MKRPFFAFLVLIVLGIITYLPSFGAKLFWDDEDFVTKNQYVIHFQVDKFFTHQAIEGAGKPSNYFRPVQFTLYAMLYHFFGPNPLAFHATNIAVHIAAALLIFIFFRFLLSFFDVPKSIPLTVSILTSLVFLLHPVQTEAVSYVSGLSDPLVALFGFLTLTLFLYSVFSKKKPRILWYIGALASYVLTMGSKESGLIFAFLVFFLTVVLPNKREERIKTIAFSIPFLFFSVLYLLYHGKIDVMSMAQAWGDHPYTYSPFIRLTQFFYLLPQYVVLLLFPLKLVYEHDFLIRILTSVVEPIAWLTIGGIVFVAIELYQRYKQKSIFPLIAFSFIAFFTAFLPFTGLILINGIMYEHFLYVPLVFFFFLLFLVLFSLPHKYHALLFGSLALCLSLLIVRSWIRQYTWADPVRFFTTTLKDAPKSFRVHNNLGRIYDNTQQYELAQKEYQAVITLDPTLPHGYHNMGQLLLEQGKLGEAEQYFQKAIQVDPYFSYSYASLLELYAKTHQDQKKAEVEKAILERFPQNSH